MTSFKWKRKVGDSVNKEAAKKFCASSVEEDSQVLDEDELDILQRVKTPKVIALEDKIAKKNRLYEEGCLLATNQRYWEALKKWDEAIHLCPEEGKLYEMKSQVLMELQEVHPAIQAAEQAVKTNPVWWVAYQTLGRALLSVGEVQLAIRNFCKAWHLNPVEKELWDEDLKWACSLREKSKEISRRELLQPREENISIHELGEKEEEITACQIYKSNVSTEDGFVNQSSDLTLTKHEWIKMRKT